MGDRKIGDKKIWSHVSVPHFSVGIRLEGGERDGQGRPRSKHLRRTWVPTLLGWNDPVAPLPVAATPSSPSG